MRFADGRGLRLGAIVVAVAALAAAVVVVLVLRGGSGGGSAQPATSPTPAGSATGAPAPGNDTALLAGRAGFGRAVQGGAGGRVVHVRSAGDDGPGSLRAALVGGGARSVVFDSDLTIHLATPLAIPSQTTIDGRGHRVEITGHGVAGLDIVNVHDVIIESIVLHDFGDVAKTKANNTPDAIHIAAAHEVWIDHDDLSMAGDKLIAVDEGSTDITVSWNHFHDQQQVFQIGNQANAAQNADQSVTIHHNFFDHTGYRNPVVSTGKAHVYNNYYLDWQLYAVRAERNGQMVLENNIFQPGPSIRGSLVTPAGDGCNDKRTRCDDRPGLLRATGNLAEAGTKLLTSNPSAVFDPHKDYPYQAQPADAALRARIVAQAGPVA